LSGASRCDKQRQNPPCVPACQLGRAWLPRLTARHARALAPSYSGVRRWRPFLRRAARTFRPPTDFMRARNPCVLARRLLRGWYVRFGKTVPLQFAACSPCPSLLNYIDQTTSWLGKHTRAALAAHSESSSVLAPTQKGQESAGVAYREGAEGMNLPLRDGENSETSPDAAKSTELPADAQPSIARLKVASVCLRTGCPFRIVYTAF
jgi:hypothetical protein